MTIISYPEHSVSRIAWRIVVLSMLTLPGFPLQAAHAQATQSLASTDTLPPDTAVTIGTLPNGLRYYIRVNKKPEHRAELRLVVKAGSLMEDDDQRGLAHFVEHMSFRGTTHFQGTQIVEYLKSIGVGFGSDLNAETEFDHTTYILPIPTDTLAQVKEALQIMGDWAHGVAFRPQDMEEERNIILGERRRGLGAGMRVMQQVIPVLYKGSRYPDRLPIGTKESVEHATRDQIVRFYQKWYRPDRMAIIAVGDFNKHQMEQMIREQFSQIPTPTTPLADPVFPVPSQPGTLFSMVRDTELTNTDVMVIYKGAPYQRNTVAAERASLVRNMFDEMLNQRLQDILEVPNAPFMSAGIDHNLYDMDPTTVSMVGPELSVVNGGVTRGLDSVLIEVARVAQHGFTATEFDRQKASLLAQLDHLYQDRNDRFSDAYVDSYVANFLTGEAIPSIETEVAVDRQLIPTLTRDEINREAGFWKQTNNRVVIVTQPKQANAVAPDTMAMLSLLSTVATVPVAPYVDKTPSDALLEHAPVPGKVVSEKQYPKIGVTEWTLSNGAVVFLKPTTFKADEILFAGSSLGGQSLLPDTLFPTAGYISAIVSAGRFGRFSSSDLEKRLSGKVAQLSTSVDGTSEDVQGSAAPKDLETMLQLAYLQMTDPRYDSISVTAAAQQMRLALANISADPGTLFSDTVSATLSQYSKRVPLPDSALVSRVNLKQAFTLYKDRFADASGFVFSFAGAFTPEEIKPLVERYLASLPSLHRRDQVQDHPEFHEPQGVIHKTVIAGQEPTTTTVLHFGGPFDPTPQNGNDLQRMAELLQNRLNNSLRERLAGTYSVGVQAERSPAPISEYAITIEFEAEPSRREELVKAVFAEIDSLKQGQFTPAEVQKVIAPVLRQRESARQTNGYWLQVASFYQEGRDLNDLLDDTRLQATTPQHIQQAAQQYLNTNRYAEFDLLPAKTAAAGSSGK
ncbi:MAG TPA: insulinase family protein [Gemmatimonadaceae bacterium]|jgi:zinc protease|nr:insulinase family protein [Gemmatimonadaceae bacterium]